MWFSQIEIFFTRFHPSVHIVWSQALLHILWCLFFWRMNNISQKSFFVLFADSFWFVVTVAFVREQRCKKYHIKIRSSSFFVLLHTSAEWYGIHKKNELAKPRINYESRTIMWNKTPNFEGKKPADFEKTHISVILYYKIDHFCPLKSNFHPFSAIWPNVWVLNSLLPSC